MWHHGAMSFAHLLDDAAQRLDVAKSELSCTQFTQSFSSTACGFPGIAGQAFTDALVTVVRAGDGACVYVGDRLAYQLAEANELLDQDVKNESIIPAAHYEGQYDPDHWQPWPAFEVRGSKRGVRRGPHALSRAIDEAWMIARYGLQGHAPRSAEVLVAGTDEVVARVNPDGDSPQIERLDAIERYSDSTRFPRIAP
jgi:hypothetical protein